ncbi:replicative DNA helicase [Thermotomaculum hydrothermale]|uniref:Replicative DNA helicase n=1 Tax=Thermotomaculum hydrothermale TaxID=981385 RepID=A0A7R6PXE7_9BACT|nr:replicative DNA helicase [Thermotomaculum hydrothermale]BBB32465.1 replicative DNA helicase [Thermotomaculum hydrothermale]
MENIRLPYNEEAERGVLGALFLDPENIFKISHIIEVEDFYLTPHRIIFSIILEIFEEGKHFDLITVKNRLQEKGLLENAGGDIYISSLVDNVPMLKNIEEYAEIIVDKAKVRKLMSVAEKILTEGSNDTPSKHLISLVEKDLFEVAIGRNKDVLKLLKDGIVDVISSIEERRDFYLRNKSTQGIVSPFSDLNRFIPAFQPGELVIVAARPSIGKTSFALSMALDIAKKGHVVSIFSLEMPFDQIALRLLCMEGEVNVKAAREGSLSEAEYNKLVQAANALENLKIYVDDSASLTVADLRAKLQKLKMDNDGKLDLVLVDYLQLMHEKTDKREMGNRALEVSQISRGLKILAKDLHVPFIVLSQLNRAIEQRKDAQPMLSDLRESGSIEQDADIVMFLHRKDTKKVGVSEDDSKIPFKDIDLIVAKNRNGPIARVKLLFHKSCTKFVSMQPHMV